MPRQRTTTTEPGSVTITAPDFAAYTSVVNAFTTAYNVADTALSKGSPADGSKLSTHDLLLTTQTAAEMLYRLTGLRRWRQLGMAASHELDEVTAYR